MTRDTRLEILAFPGLLACEEPGGPRYLNIVFAT